MPGVPASVVPPFAKQAKGGAPRLIKMLEVKDRLQSQHRRVCPILALASPCSADHRGGCLHI